MKLRKVGILLVTIFLCCTMAMAQASPAISWKHPDHFPKLPPLTVEFDISLYHRSKPHLMQMSLDSKQDKDTASCQSVILRHKEQKMESQYQVDNFKGVRDRIVRERRQKEGIPLPPPHPYLMRNK